MRSDWQDRQALFLGIKAGNNRASHGHLDIGSFVLDAKGLRWAVDLGPDNYNLPGYFGRARWRYFRLNTLSHNTIVIAGKLQNTAAHCDVVSFHSSPRRACTVLDLTDAYRGQAKRVLRGAQMLDRSAIHIRDEITDPVGTLRWAMVTPAKVNLNGSTATLTQEGRRIIVKLLEPAGASFTVLSTKPPTAKERQNRDTRMLAIELDRPAGNKTTISVLIQTDEHYRPPAEAVRQPLSAWPR